MSRPLITSAFAFSLLLFCLGCGPSLGRPLDAGKPIVIQILSSGVPLQAGRIDLSAAGGGATLSPSGIGNFEHVPFGTYKVVVLPPDDLSNIAPPADGALRAAAKKPAKGSIAKKFQHEHSTPFSIEVTERGESRFEFDLAK